MMTPEQIEQHRKRFEEAMRFKGFVNAHFEKNRIGGYLDTEIQSRFSGYIMAIESIEIEITEMYKKESDDYNWGYNAAISDCEDAIQSLGIKIKER